MICVQTDSSQSATCIDQYALRKLLKINQKVSIDRLVKIMTIVVYNDEMKKIYFKFLKAIQAHFDNSEEKNF